MALQGDAGRQALVGEHIVEPRIGRQHRAAQLLDPRVVEQIIDDAVAALDAALDTPERTIETRCPSATAVSLTANNVLRMALSGLRSSWAMVAVS